MGSNVHTQPNLTPNGGHNVSQRVPSHGWLAVVSERALSHEGVELNDDALLEYWSDFMRAEGCTETTIKERGIVIHALLRRTDRTLITMTRHHLIADLARDLSPKTKQNYKSLYHTLFTWLQDEGFRADNPAARLPRSRVPRSEPDPVRTDEIQQLLASGIYAKTRMYVLLYAYQGFRAIEIAAVAGENIDWVRQRILSVEGKGGKEVWRPIHPVVWAEAQKYPQTGFWFPSGEGHISRKTVSNVLSKAFKRAGVQHRPHQLRAWHATELIDAGVSTIVAQHSMRHSDLQSLNRYVRVSDESLREAMGMLPNVIVPTRSGRVVRQALVAQRIEHPTSNRTAARSNRAGGTSIAA